MLTSTRKNINLSTDKNINMKNDNSIFSTRLKQARILNKLSMDALSAKMNGLISKQAISKYESGKMKPNSSVLIALCEALKIDIDYLYRPFSLSPESLNVSFRKKSDTNEKDINALKVQIQDQIERYIEIEEILNKKNSAITTSIKIDNLSTPSQMRLAANSLRTEWQIGIDAIANVQDTLEEHGIKVIMTNAPKEFDGVSGIVNNKDFIIVLNNNIDNIERRRFTTLHELCHLLFNEHFSSDLKEREKERLCDAFANEMLLPSSVINQHFSPNSKISTYELKSLQMSYGISQDAIMHKLTDLGYINENRYKSYCIRKNKDTNFKKEVEVSIYKENTSNRFQSMVFSALAKHLISISKAASLLNISEESVCEQLNII